MCRGLAGATPENVREMFSAAMTSARPATAVLAASDDEDMDAEYRAKQPKGSFVSSSNPPKYPRICRAQKICLQGLKPS